MILFMKMITRRWIDDMAANEFAYYESMLCAKYNFIYFFEYSANRSFDYFYTMSFGFSVDRHYSGKN